MSADVWPPSDVAELVRLRAEHGEKIRMLLFYGHRGPVEPVGPWCLSQWWLSPSMVDGVTYPTAEHWMMAAKARLFGDDATERRILSADSPAEAKALGRCVTGFDEAVWDAARSEIVLRGTLEKFRQNPKLLAYLGSTAGLVLAEASPYDRVWGIGLAASDRRAHDPAQWRGLNLLGFALMEARARLAEQSGGWVGPRSASYARPHDATG